MAALPRDSFAMHSSLQIGKTFSLHPRMSVWSDSRTRECPLRSSSIRASNAPEMIEMRLATTTTPPMVTTSIAMRKPVPSSPPMVPASRVRMRLPQAVSQNPSSSSGGKAFTMTTTSDTIATNAIVTRPRRPMSAGRPRDMIPSNQ